MTEMQILVIDDEPEIRDDIAYALKRADFSVSEAASGSQALEMIAIKPPDLVLCDITMPVMDGYKVLEEFRSRFPDLADVPFIFLTALAARKDIMLGKELGADDYLTKPVDFELLLITVKARLRQIERIRQHKNKEDELLNKELERGQVMQAGLLPCPKSIAEAEALYSLKISSHYEASQHLGGDIWGMESLGAEKIAFYLADFSGHGLSASLNTFRLSGIIGGHIRAHSQPAAILKAINLELTGTLPRGQYAAMLLGILDCKQNMFSYSTASSTPPLVWRQKEVLSGQGNGLPLGLSKAANYTNRELALNPGDTLFLYSDALPEAGWQEKKALGFSGVADLFRKTCLEADCHLEALLEPFFAVNSRPLSDDLTVLIVSRG